MSGNIKKEDIEHLTKLARIDLSETEKQKFLQNAEQILGYFEELKQADTDNIYSIGARNGITNITNITGEDEINQELNQKGIESFPKTEKGCLITPEIMKNSNE